MGKTDEKPSLIIAAENDSGFVDNSQSFVFAIDNGGVEEYTDDEDPGFIVHEVPEECFEKACKELAEKYGFPARTIKAEPKGMKWFVKKPYRCNNKR